MCEREIDSVRKRKREKGGDSIRTKEERRE